MPSANQFEHHVFICCAQADLKWGRWLQQSLQRYKLPKSLRGKQARDGILSRSLGQITLDTNERPTSRDIGARLRDNLDNSGYLIVVCSPAAARSKWIEEQILTFKRLGNEHRILCLIVDGEPNATEKPEFASLECFPNAIKYQLDADGELSSTRTEPIAADARPDKDGKTNSKLKLIAGVLGVNYNDLKQREKRRQRKRYVLVGGGVLVVLVGLLAWWFYQQWQVQQQTRLSEAQVFNQQLADAEAAIQQQRWHDAVTRFAQIQDQLAANQQFQRAHLSPEQQRRFAVGLAFALQQNQLIRQLNDHSAAITWIDASPNQNWLVSASSDGEVILYNTNTWQIMRRWQFDAPQSPWFSADSKTLVLQAQRDTWRYGEAPTPKVTLYQIGTQEENVLYLSSAEVSIIAGGYHQLSRDAVVVQSWNDELILHPLSDPSAPVRLQLPADASVTTVDTNFTAEQATVFSSTHGLLRFNFAEPNTAATDIPECQHKYTMTPARSSEGQSYLVKVEDADYLLCDFATNTATAITTYGADTVQFASDDKGIWFIDAGLYYDASYWQLASASFVEEPTMPVVMQLRLQELEMLQNYSTDYQSQQLALGTNWVVTDGQRMFITKGSQLTPTPTQSVSRQSELESLGWREHQFISPKQDIAIHIKPSGGIFDPTIVTLTDRAQKQVLFEYQDIGFWALSSNRRYLVLESAEHGVLQFDLSLAPNDPKSIAYDTSNFAWQFGGANRDRVVGVTQMGEVVALDVSTGQSKTIGLLQQAPKSADLIFDGNYLVADINEGVVVMNVNDGTVQTLATSRNNTYTVALTYPWLLLTTKDGYLKLINAASNREHHVFDDQDGLRWTTPSKLQNFAGLSLFTAADSVWRLNYSKQSLERLPTCAGELPRQFALDAKRQLILMATRENLCVLTIEAGRPVYVVGVPSASTIQALKITADAYQIDIGSNQHVAFKPNLNLTELLRQLNDVHTND